MELRNLKTFLRAAELGSLSRAAAELGYAQSTVTTQIQQLEAEIGAPLFETIGRKSYLTDPGTRLMSYGSRMLALEQQALDLKAESSAHIRGSLRIGAPESISSSILLSCIGRYRSAFPHVHLSILTGLSSQLFEMLAKNEADLIYTMGELSQRQDSVCVFSHLEEAVFVAGGRHPLAGRRTPVTPEEIFGEEIIVTGENSFLQDRLHQMAAACGKSLRSHIQTGSSGMIMNLVRQGLGIAFLPKYLIDTQPDLKPIPFSGPDTGFYSHIFHHKNKWVTPQMRGMLELTEQLFED